MRASSFVVVSGAAFILAQPATSQPLPTSTGLPLGANCNPAIPDACANGVDCYATNFMLIPRCGSFQASCTSNSQCAFNACNRAQGLCNGFLAANATTASTTSTNGTTSATATRSGANASTAFVPTSPAVSRNFSVTAPTTKPTSTSPLVASDATKTTWSLVCLLAVASLVAFAL